MLVNMFHKLRVELYEPGSTVAKHGGIHTRKAVVQPRFDLARINVGLRGRAVVACVKLEERLRETCCAKRVANTLAQSDRITVLVASQLRQKACPISKHRVRALEPVSRARQTRRTARQSASPQRGEHELPRECTCSWVAWPVE